MKVSIRATDAPPIFHYLYLKFPAPAGGGVWRFQGQKTVRVLQLRHTMTHLVGELTGPEGERGPAELTFDLAELGSFLASFRFCLGRPSPTPALAARLEAPDPDAETSPGAEDASAG